MPDDKILILRHELHRKPEISNKEFETSKRITDFIIACLPDEVIDLSKTGKAFVFKGNETGEILMFRSELDALPITESANAEYSSTDPNAAHSCGHDGHMAILAGLAHRIAVDRPQKGKVVLLFQPAEEMEQGAKAVIEDPDFKGIEPDYIFALHNIPGEEINKILLKTGAFAAASKGLTVKLFGKPSHAAEPEKGISPANAIARIILDLNELMENKGQFTDVVLLTIIHIRLGEVSFGTTPGYAEIMMTLRAFNNQDMDFVARKSENIIKNVAQSEKLKFDISYNEDFPAVINDPGCVRLVEQSAVENNLSVKYLTAPYKWSEDFAYFTQNHKGCYFGLGAGVLHPALHSPDYDFPDEIIEAGINIFFNIYKKINFKNE